MDYGSLKEIERTADRFFIRTILETIYTNVKIKLITEKNVCFFDKYHELIYLSNDRIVEFRPERKDAFKGRSR